MTANSEKGASDPPSTNGKASHNESDVYDRQIRLWGAEAQVRMYECETNNILFACGHSRVFIFVADFFSGSIGIEMVRMA